ncbi:alpha/beta hydrolase fold domain-containing protein [Ferruginibacter sp.]|nr:alpha/beta hydrolase [Ferruginibacter sp.]
MKILQQLLVITAATLIVTSCKKSSTDTTNTNPAVAQSYSNLSYGTDAAQKMDVFLPANRSTANTKAMIIIHGGAWSSGDKADLNAFIDTLKRRMPDYAIFNINYRLATGTANFFPTQENDVKTAIEFIYSKRSEYLISDKFVLNGQSAGGHLALLHAYKYTTPVKIKAVIDFFGPSDMVDLYNNPGLVPAATIALIVGATPSSNATLYQQSSPINFVTTQSSPTIILQGGADLLVNATTQSLALKNKLVTTGAVNQYVFYPTGGHGDWNAATYTDAFNNIQAFLAANVQ